MKLHFYDEFQCIAGECPITCCSRWKIAVDDVTCQKWKGKTISIKGAKDKELLTYITEKECAKLICMGNSKDCHFLNEDKLCELVISYGEELLSKTCREFPRLFHAFGDREEVSLTGCCPVVIDRLQSVPDVEFLEEPDTDKDWKLHLRKHIVAILKNREYSLEKALMMAFYLLSEAREDSFYKEEEILELAQALEKGSFSSVDAFFENNELFLDVTDNYKKQGIYDEFLLPLIEKAEEIADAYTDETAKKEWKLFQSAFENYTELLRKYLVLEIYNQFLLPDYDWEDMLVALEWIGMEYAVMRHGIFLQWKLKKELSYEMVKETLVYIARMMGYDEADIREYLEESFESIIWDWGYFAWIVDNRI